MPAPNRPVDSARGTKSRSGTADSSLRSSADPLPRSTRRSRARSTRKSSTEIEDSMEKDPDLWGLRRSVSDDVPLGGQRLTIALRNDQNLPVEL